MSRNYIGAHVSTYGGVENAPLHAQRIGAEGFALFTRNQRRWESPALTEESISLFKQRMKDGGFTPDVVLPHNSYLINLASPDPEKSKKSFDSYIDELNRVNLLGLKYLNIHPGSTTGLISFEQGIENISAAVNRANEMVPDVITVLETTSGQNNKIGGRFEEIAAIMDRIKQPERVAICIDTCHVYGAGYDVSTEEGCNDMLEQFDRLLGLSNLKGMHLNDSKRGLGEHIDRHENIGKGCIGETGFRYLLNDKRLEGIPMILETPNPKDWDTEIALLHSFLE